MRTDRLITCFLAALVLSGCASRPINEPIAQVDPRAGYRPYLLIPKRQNNDPHTLFVLSFSGGGTRAAAFSYGVLEELRRTKIVVDGQRRRLIDEVDLITGVSGGSFTALSYALYGERLFSGYEQRFLKRDVQGALVARGLNPFNWWKFIGGSAGRSELAAEYYDEILFEGATFGDLLDKPGPVALSPVTFNNYGGTCGYQYPAWVKDITDPDNVSRPAGRALQRYHNMQDFQDSENRPYIHLVDGGVSDNIGVRGVLEALEELAASAAFQGEVGFGVIRRVVLIVVNSHSSPSTDWDRHESPPGFVVQLLQSAGVPIERYSFETVESMKDLAQIWAWRRELRVAQARLAGATKAQAEASMPKVTLEVLDVSFDAIPDPEERAYFMNLPTTFVLPAEAVDRLREVAGRLLRQSADYESVVRELGGTPPKFGDDGGGSI